MGVGVDVGVGVGVGWVLRVSPYRIICIRPAHARDTAACARWRRLELALKWVVETRQASVAADQLQLGYVGRAPQLPQDMRRQPATSRPDLSIGGAGGDGLVSGRRRHAGRRPR